PKHLYCGVKTTQFANFLTVASFNESHSGILNIFETMRREKAPCAEPKKARITRKNENLVLNSFYGTEEGVLYGLRIAD
ncbi:hypothetical protein WH47_10709, partial [Habropoda laboriosa]